jgi:hypothetical protein
MVPLYLIDLGGECWFDFLHICQCLCFLLTVLVQLVLAVPIQTHVFLGDVSYFLRRQIKITIVADPSKSYECIEITVIIHNPVNMEVLNGSTVDLGMLEGYLDKLGVVPTELSPHGS